MWDGHVQCKARTQSGSNDWTFRSGTFVNASKGHGFSVSISHTLETHEILTAHKLWSKLSTPEKAAFLANCGRGCWSPRGLKPRQSKGSLTRNGKQRPGGRLRLWTEEHRAMRMRPCSRDMRRTTPRHARKAHGALPIHDRVRDSLAR